MKLGVSAPIPRVEKYDMSERLFIYPSRKNDLPMKSIAFRSLHLQALKLPYVGRPQCFGSSKNRSFLYYLRRLMTYCSKQGHSSAINYPHNGLSPLCWEFSEFYYSNHYDDGRTKIDTSSACSKYSSDGDNKCIYIYRSCVQPPLK